MPEAREVAELDDPLPRRWHVPLRYEEAEIVLQNMAGDWPKYRSMRVQYRARLVAARRVGRMIEAAQAHDSDRRGEMRKAGQQ